MNRFLLGALAVAAISGPASAYDKATPAMMKGGLTPISSRTLPTGETEMTFGMSLSRTANSSNPYLTLGNSAYFGGFTAASIPLTRADEETQPYMDFTFAGNPAYINGLNGMDGTKKVYLTLYFPEIYTQLYKDCRLKDLKFLTGSYGEPQTGQTPVNRLTSATLFTAKTQADIPGNLSYEKTSKVTGVGLSDGVLEFDDEIFIKEGEPFFIGYAVTPQSTDDLFLVTDGNSTSDAAGALVGIAADGVISSDNWINVGPDLGNLCIYVTIVGDALPKNGATIYNMSLPMQLTPGEKFDAQIDVINMTSNDITNFEYTYKLGNQPTQTVTYELEGVLPYGNVVPITLAGLSCEEPGLDIPFEFEITKVNGEDNFCKENPIYTNTSVTMAFKCFDQEKGFEPHALIEEGTSSRCGYCPIGISMMEYAEANYPDYYHRAALHYNMGAGADNEDPMFVESNLAMADYFPTLPSSYINRWADFYPGAYKDLLPYFQENYGSEKAVAGVVNLNVAPTGVASEAPQTKVTAEVQFALDVENPDNRFRLGFYITEDNVGPYKQLNYFNGMAGDFDGWEKMPTEIRKQYYNDVVRNLVGGAQGCENSLPASIKAGETYSFSTAADISAVEGEDYKVIAFLMDNDSNEVLNSAIISTTKTADVNDLEMGVSAKVYGVEGGVIIRGEYASGDVVAIDGKKMAHLDGAESVALPAGLYIVTVDGKSVKVVVK